MPVMPGSSEHSSCTGDNKLCQDDGIGAQLKVSSENGSTAYISIENGCERKSSDLKLQHPNTEEHPSEEGESPGSDEQTGRDTESSESAITSSNGIGAANVQLVSLPLKEVDNLNKASEKQQIVKGTSLKQQPSTIKAKRLSPLSSKGNSVSVEDDKRQCDPEKNINSSRLCSTEDKRRGVINSCTTRKGKPTKNPSRVQPEESGAARSVIPENVQGDSRTSPAEESDSDRDKAERKPNETFIKQNKAGMSSVGGIKATRLHVKGNENFHRALSDIDDAELHNPDLGPFLLMLAKTTIASGDNPHKALDFAIRAAKSFEKSANGKPSLELVMSLHTLASIHSTLRQFKDSIPVLEYSIRMTDVETGGIDHALAAFAGHMQLGDTFALLGRSEDAIAAYHAGLEVQKLCLGDMDPRVGETYRYLAEAHVQVMQYNKAEELCKHALEIHKHHSPPASVGEATDRRLMGLIYSGKGEHETALEHLVLASMSLIANGMDVEVAAVDCSIGDLYVSLGRFDEAIFAYQKALTVFKSAQGEFHASVASVYISLAELYLKTGKVRESKTYCDSALRIYGRYGGGHQLNDVATGLTEIAAVYEALNEHEQALPLLQKALCILDTAPGQQSAAAGVEAQIGVLYYMAGNYKEAYAAFRNAVTKLRVGADRKSSLLGIMLNQMGLVCVQLYRVDEAVGMFEEAKTILEQSRGPYHPDTLAVHSNLAGAYDALGRLDDAINVLQHVVEVREEKLGTADPEVDEERRRLAELLRETGRTRPPRPNGTLELLIEFNPQQADASRERSTGTEHQHNHDVAVNVLQKRIEVAAH